jgi:hypothetical protein
MANEILFGSGELFIVTDNAGVEVETKVGESSGEASLNVSYDFRDIRGGSKNQILKSMATSETVAFNCGILTYDLNSIKDFVAGYYAEDTTAGTRTLGIGGNLNVPVKQLRFVHTKEDGKTITLDMYKAQNRAGLNWVFNPEEETVFGYEFTLLADTAKTNGNIVQITEQI